MKNITITKENLLKAHSEGCDDTKKVLETLCPDEFEDEIEYDEDKIYGYNYCGVPRKIHKIDDRFWSIAFDDTRNFGIMETSFEEFLSYLKKDNLKLETFDNSKDFLFWALKQVS